MKQYVVEKIRKYCNWSDSKFKKILPNIRKWAICKIKKNKIMLYMLSKITGKTINFFYEDILLKNAITKDYKRIERKVYDIYYYKQNLKLNMKEKEIYQILSKYEKLWKNK